MKDSLRILLHSHYQIEIQETIWHPHIFRDQPRKMFCCTTNNSCNLHFGIGIKTTIIPEAPRREGKRFNSPLSTNLSGVTSAYLVPRAGQPAETKLPCTFHLLKVVISMAEESKIPSLNCNP